MDYLKFNEDININNYIYLVPQNTGNYMSYVGNPELFKPPTVFYDNNENDKENGNNNSYIIKFYVASISIIMLYIFYILYNKTFLR
jgi:hypothetical protein